MLKNVTDVTITLSAWGEYAKCYKMKMTEKSLKKISGYALLDLMFLFKQNLSLFGDDACVELLLKVR